MAGWRDCLHADCSQWLGTNTGQPLAFQDYFRSLFGSCTDWPMELVFWII